jgi:hypothetical protein
MSGDQGNKDLNIHNMFYKEEVFSQKGAQLVKAATPPPSHQSLNKHHTCTVVFDSSSHDATTLKSANAYAIEVI